MNPPLGIDWEIWAIVSSIVIVLIGSTWKFAHWKGGLDQWRREITDWRNDVSTTLNDLQKDVTTMMGGIEAIKTELVKSVKNGMVGYHSPFVASPKAIEVLERLSLLTEIDANYSYIVEKVNEQSKLPIYSDTIGTERRFIELAPGVIHGLVKAGKIEEKKIDIAMEELENVFKAGAVGYYAVLLVITAYILEKEGDKGYPADVSMVYSQIDAMDSDSPDELLEMFGGDLDRAIESFETAVRTLGEIGSNELAEKQVRLAALYKMAGRKDEALKQLKEAIAHKPDYAAAHSNLGNLLNNLKRYDEAEKEYREAIRADPDYAKAHYNLGILLKYLKRYDEAEKEYREAIRADPDYAKAHYNLGNLLKYLKRYDEAEKEYREAIRADPDYVAAHSNLGLLLKYLKRYDEAEKEYREAIRANPDHATAHYNLGNLLKYLKRYDEAEKEYREAIRANPDHAKAHYNLGNLLKYLKRYDEAEKEYREAIRANPDHATAHANLGFLLSAIDRNEEAIQEFNTALNLKDQLPDKGEKVIQALESLKASHS
jgi:tetratricopeptide (TPR) repeat protein